MSTESPSLFAFAGYSTLSFLYDRINQKFTFSLCVAGDDVAEIIPKEANDNYLLQGLQVVKSIID